ncbi:methyl-accepting chemotaxis protein [Fodinisporobacter ferrooxydans]|uniref:Methyl-accepting chemotaxis protein n=1 Tax=Fodinisporobacter ferrooxydans TaxID=2901836 RepID=A0ABY4CFJ2_9BACL|nr:methyl-accepting chemotaxis protein [Alicyclobacillaceae bacterium MYW30-H2]
MHQTLKNIYFSMPFFQNVFPEDAHILLCDTEKVLVSLSGKNLDMGVQEGTRISDLKGTAAEQALTTRKIIRDEKGPEKFGIPYIGMGVPLFEDDQLIGVLSIAMSNTRYEKLRNDATELTAMVEELSATTDEISTASTHVAVMAQEASQLADEMSKFVNQIDHIAGFVHNVSTQTHLLGLNATIEAAHAGESGRGFTVVAQEIRKLAEQSKQATKEISNELTRIQEQMQKMVAVLHSISADTEEHAASILNLKVIFEHISGTADDMMSLSNVTASS